jgi:hypothetical protein
MEYILRRTSKIITPTPELKQLVRKFAKYVMETKNQLKERRSQSFSKKDTEANLLKQKIIEFIKSSFKEKGSKNDAKIFFYYLAQEYSRNITGILSYTKILTNTITEDKIVDFVKNFYDFEDELIVMKDDILYKINKEIAEDSYLMSLIYALSHMKACEVVDPILEKEKDNDIQDIGAKTVMVMYIFHRIIKFKINLESETNVEIGFVTFLNKSIDHIVPTVVNLLSDLIEDSEMRTIFQLINSDDLSKMFNELSNIPVLRRSLFDIMVKVNANSKDGIKIRSFRKYVIDNNCLEGLLSTIKTNYFQNNNVDIFKDLLHLLIICSAYYDTEKDIKKEIYKFLLKMFEDMTVNVADIEDYMFRTKKYINEIFHLAFLNSDDLKGKLCDKGLNQIESTQQLINSTTTYKDISVLEFLLSLFDDMKGLIIVDDRREEDILKKINHVRRTILVNLLDYDLNIIKYRYLISNTSYCTKVLEYIFTYPEEIISYPFNTILLIISENVNHLVDSSNLAYTPDKEIKAIFKRLDDCDDEAVLRIIFKYLRTFLDFSNVFQKLFVNCGLVIKLKELFDKSLRIVDNTSIRTSSTEYNILDSEYRKPFSITKYTPISVDILLAFIGFVESILNNNPENIALFKSFNFLELYFNKFIDFTDYKQVAYKIWSVCMLYETDNNEIIKFSKFLINKRYLILKETLNKADNIELFKYTVDEIFSINEIIYVNYLNEKFEKIFNSENTNSFLNEIFFDFINILQLSRQMKEGSIYNDINSNIISPITNPRQLQTDFAGIIEVENETNPILFDEDQKRNVCWDRDLHTYLKKYLQIFLDLIFYFNSLCFAICFKTAKMNINKRGKNFNIESNISQKQLKSVIKESIHHVSLIDDGYYLKDLICFLIDKAMRFKFFDGKKANMSQKNGPNNKEYYNNITNKHIGERTICEYYIEEFKIDKTFLNSSTESISNYSNFILQSPIIVKYMLSSIIELNIGSSVLLQYLDFIILLCKTNENNIKSLLRKKLVKSLLSVLANNNSEINEKILEIFELVTKFLSKNDLEILFEFILCYVNNKDYSHTISTLLTTFQKSLKLAKKMQRNVILSSIVTRQPNIYNIIYTSNLKFYHNNFKENKNKITHLSFYVSLKFHKGFNNTSFSLFKLDKESKDNKDIFVLDIFVENNALKIKNEKEIFSCDEFSKYARLDKNINLLFILAKETNLMEIYINEKLLSHFSIDLKQVDLNASYTLATGFTSNSTKELYQDTFESFSHVSISYFMIYADKLTTENMIHFKLSQVFTSKNGSCRANKIKLKYLDKKTYKMLAPNYMNKKDMLEYSRLNIDPNKVVYELVSDNIGLLTNNKLNKLKGDSSICNNFIFKIQRRFYTDLLEKDFITYIPNTNLSNSDNGIYNNTYLINKNNLSECVYLNKVFDIKRVKVDLLHNILNCNVIIDKEVQSFRFVSYLMIIITNSEDIETMTKLFKLLGIYLLSNMHELNEFCETDHFKAMLISLYKNHRYITKDLIDLFFNLSLGLEDVKDINFFNPLYPKFITEVMLDIYLFKLLDAELQNYIIDTLKQFYQKFIFISYDSNFDTKVDIICKLYRILALVGVELYTISMEDDELSTLDDNIINLIQILLEQTLKYKKGEVEPNEIHLKKIINFSNDFFEIIGYFEDAVDNHIKQRRKSLIAEQHEFTLGTLSELFKKLFHKKIKVLHQRIQSNFSKVSDEFNFTSRRSSVKSPRNKKSLNASNVFGKNVVRSSPRTQTMKFNKKDSKNFFNFDQLILNNSPESLKRSSMDRVDTLNKSGDWAIISRDNDGSIVDTESDCIMRKCNKCSFIRETMKLYLNVICKYNDYKSYIKKFNYYLFLKNPDSKYLKHKNIKHSFYVFDHEGVARIRNKMIAKWDRIHNEELNKKYYDDYEQVIQNEQQRNLKNKPENFINIKKIIDEIFFCDQIFNLNFYNTIDGNETVQLATNCLFVKECYQLDCVIILLETKFYILFNTHLDNNNNLLYSKNKFKKSFWIVNEYREEMERACDQLFGQDESCSIENGFNNEYQSDNKKLIEKLKINKFLRGRKDFKIKSYEYNKISELHKRRFLLKQNSLEFFFKNGKNFFIAVNVDKRDKVFETIVKGIKDKKNFNLTNYMINCPSTMFSRNTQLVVKKQKGKLQKSELGIIDTKNLLEECQDYWSKGLITTYNYLIIVNTIAGRSYNDISQYFTMPWILKDYISDGLNLNTEDIYRDLSRPIYAMDENNYENLMSKYTEADDSDKFHSGSHYSTPGFVCYFLIRLKPFSHISAEIQGGYFDMSDRLFFNIKGLWDVSDKYQELIPEMFYLPELLVNYNQFNFGLNHNQVCVDNVLLPKWAKTCPRLYIKLNKKALESAKVSSRITEWIDLIFGFKQQGKEAIKSLNVYRQLCYEGKIDINKLEEKEREDKMVEIHDFGQIPLQLFTRIHPKRECHEKCPAFFSRPAYLINFIHCKDKDSTYKMYTINLETRPKQIRGYYECYIYLSRGEGGLSSFKTYYDNEDKSIKIHDSMNTFTIVGEKKFLLGPKNNNFIDWSFDKYSFFIINPIAKIAFEFQTYRESPIADIKSTLDGKNIIIAFKDGSIVLYKLKKEKERVKNPDLEKKENKSIFKMFKKTVTTAKFSEKSVKFNTTDVLEESRVIYEDCSPDYQRPMIRYFTEEWKDYCIHYNQSGLQLSKKNLKGSSIYKIKQVRSHKIINSPIKFIEKNQAFSLLIVVDVFNKIYLFDLNKFELLREINFPKIMKTSQNIFGVNIDGLTGEFIVILNYMIVLFNINGVLIGTLNINEYRNISKITCAILKSVNIITYIA